MNRFSSGAAPVRGRISLSVNEAKRGAVLTVPRHATLDEAGRFLAQHFEWLQKRLAAIPAPVPFMDGEIVLPLRGEDHVCAFPARAETPRGGVDRGRCRHHAPFDLALHSYIGRERSTRLARLRDWLKREARADLVGSAALSMRRR